ncbi:MAG: NAD(P)/FAD-dependent oxidoreductase, partial [Pseudomonadota bacterium]
GQPTDVYAEKSKWLPFRLRRLSFERKLKQINGDLARYGLQPPDHRVLESHPIINSQLIHHLQHGNISVCRDIKRFDGGQVVFIDEQRIEVDLILYATGYQYSIPYADKALFDWNGYKPSLAYSVFNRRHDSLFAVGFTEMNAGGYYIFDEMTSLIAHAIAIQVNAPEKWSQARQLIMQPTDFSGGLNFVPSERHADYLDMDTYLKACKGLAKTLGWRSAKNKLSELKPSIDDDATARLYTVTAAGV